MSGQAVEYGSAKDPISGKTYYFNIETQETFWEKPAKKVIHHGTYNAGSSSGQKSRSQSRSSASGKSRQRSATKVSGGRSSSKVKATGSKKSRKSKPKEEKRKKAPQSQSSKRRKRASGTDDEDASGSGSTDEKEEEEEEEDWNSGFEHTAANNARPEDIALAHDVDIDDLLKVNLANFPVIKAVSRLKAGTRIALPFRIYNAFNNETPTTIASKFKLPVSQLVKLNVNRHIGLRSKSKLRADTDLVLNPLGVAGGGQTGVTIATARAMGAKTSHKKK